MKDACPFKIICMYVFCVCVCVCTISLEDWVGYLVCITYALCLYRITGNVCVAKFLSFKFLHDLIFAQTEHAHYKMHVLGKLHVLKFSRFLTFAKIKSRQTFPVIGYTLHCGYIPYSVSCCFP